MKKVITIAGLMILFSTSAFAGRYNSGGAAAGTITIEECMKIDTIRVGVYQLQNAVTIEHQLTMQQANLEVFCKLKHAKGTSACPQSM